jgi:hypothetical protein
MRFAGETLVSFGLRAGKAYQGYDNRALIFVKIFQTLALFNLKKEENDNENMAKNNEWNFSADGNGNKRLCQWSYQ